MAQRSGATEEIAAKIGQVLCQAGLCTDVLPTDRVNNLHSYKAVVLGSAGYLIWWILIARRLFQLGRLEKKITVEKQKKGLIKVLKKNVIITGVSRKCGIGAAIAIRLASIGYNIFITYFRKYDNDMPGWKKDDTEVYAIIKEIKKYPIKFGSLELDLSIVDNLPVLFDNAENKLGHIYGIINNAAFSIDTDINTISAELLDKHYFINIRAPILLSKLFMGRFKKHKQYKQGRIISLTSGYETEPNPGNLAYSSTKAAMNRFTNSLAIEVAEFGVTVNSIDPGPVDTGWMTKEIKENLINSAPMHRIGNTDDVANIIEFIISEKAQWITGQIIHSRGGF